MPQNLFFFTGVSRVIVCGEHFVIVRSRMIFHSGLSVPLGSDALRAIAFRATFFLSNITVCVLSPNVVSNFDVVSFIGEVLPEARFCLNHGAFSDSSESSCWLIPGDSSFCFHCTGYPVLVWNLPDSSSTWPLCGWPAFWVFVYLKRTNVFVCMIGSISVFCLRPKWASNGVIVVLFGINFIFSINFFTISAWSASDHNGSDSTTDSLLFIVLIMRSTMSVTLWSPAGASISLKFLSLKNISNSRAINDCAWSHLYNLWIAWNE